MLERISQTLKQIEEEENVKIIYACESGSRAWGFESTDSDYDVRFIYVRPVNWYLSIYDKRDVIEKPISDSLDINGWDIRKALQLLKKSNPPLLEWLRSPILYTEDIFCIQPMKDLISSSFSPRSCIYHYLNMARGNYREHLQGDTVWTKKYFYVLRPILACKWIEEKNTMPPVEFDILLKTLLDDGPLMKEIAVLLRRKKAGEELSSGPSIPEINEFIREQVQYFDSLTKDRDNNQAVQDTTYDEVFREILRIAWN